MMASVGSSVAGWVLGSISVVGLVLGLGDAALGVVRARKGQTPLGSDGRVAVACTGRFRKGWGSSTNWPNLLFTASPDQLELKVMMRFDRRCVVVNKSDPHEIHLEEKIGYRLVSEDVAGLRAAIFSPPRAAEVERLLWEWGWLL